jgi:hypothetical protein
MSRPAQLAPSSLSGGNSWGLAVFLVVGCSVSKALLQAPTDSISISSLRKPLSSGKSKAYKRNLPDAGAEIARSNLRRSRFAGLEPDAVQPPLL